MELKINFENLHDVMQSFYLLSNMKIIIFDEEYNTVYSYPDEDCRFCEKMKAIESTAKMCAETDKRMFSECRQSGKLLLYTCHAGLVEGCAPLKYNGSIIGYIMFGQVSDLPTREVLNQNVVDVCKQYSLDKTEFLRAAKSIKLKSYENIMAAAKIFEACISYIILNEMLLPQRDKIIHECEQYIKEHLEDVTVEALCRHTGISRTSLYEAFKKKTGQGIAAFIRAKQFDRARHLLDETTLSVREISLKCGFSDYNYFSRVFKKKYGKSPKGYRKKD